MSVPFGHLFRRVTVAIKQNCSAEPLGPVEQVDFKVLEEAQNRKMDRLISMLNLKETDRILEIGCGWGSCAVRAVKVFGREKAVLCG